MTDTAEGTADPPEGQRDKPGFLRGFPGLVVSAFVIALLVKSFLFPVFFIPSASMEPTLVGPGDRILVDKVPYYFHDPRRGDIIVFSNPNAPPIDRGVIGGFFHWLGQGLGFTGHAEASCGDKNPDEDFVKRVIGLPGDTVEGKDGGVLIDGQRLSEPYLPQGLKTSPFAAQTVPEGKLFVMGDNRSDSCDSRLALGLVPIDNVIGQVAVIIWPPSRMGMP
ncbi:MAG: signal peptidase [Actinomycetota bacterium]|nr:signal peptidase [Actinomycetota bacterium]